ncbi:PREDICTED: long-chain-fatty-acid--CoA ligase ACSBG2-like, partial [Amphimedon queenslandica]|uniref:long-chain-fatty-acid--CoA ligase n=2 Tax=Amphimedon queenslandica TaxID=400682 RepID=A0AAN0JPS9_AMPQE
MTIKDSLPHLKKIVKYLPETEEPLDTEMRERGVITWEEFMELGKDVKDDELSDRVSAIKPGHCATLIYTSGTTGPPKGAMLSHDNIVFTGKAITKSCGGSHEDRGVSFLPLSHIGGQMSDLIGPVICGSCVCFAQPDALKGSLRDTLLEVHPTGILAVPRVWEKFKEAAETQFQSIGGVKKFIIRKAM